MLLVGDDGSVGRLIAEVLRALGYQIAEAAGRNGAIKLLALLWQNIIFGIPKEEVP